MDVVKVVLRLNSQFPDDVGIFCPFILNYVFLGPGEAIFLGAGKPHTYISGVCIECMGNSGHVIRVVLIPKLRNIPELVSTLTYTSAKPTAHAADARPFNSSPSTPYDPPILELNVI